jgi:hypothetical protein
MQRTVRQLEERLAALEKEKTRGDFSEAPAKPTSDV